MPVASNWATDPGVAVCLPGKARCERYCSAYEDQVRPPCEAIAQNASQLGEIISPDGNNPPLDGVAATGLQYFVFFFTK
jgi:hypothetical protein